jgi:hypothetical protein
MRHQHDMYSERRRQKSEDEQRPGEVGYPGGHLPRPTLLDVVGQASQALKDRRVVLVVRALSDTVRLRDRQREFENVDGVQPHPIAEQRCLRIDGIGRQRKVESLDDERGRSASCGVCTVMSGIVCSIGSANK